MKCNARNGEEEKSSKKKWLEYIPGGLFTTTLLFGTGYLIKMFFRMAWGYRRDLFYIMRKKGWRSAYSFFYTKMFVPVGEGAGAAWYFLFGPIVRRFPKLAPFPRYIEMEHTTVCPYRCIMCEHTYWQDQEERMMPFEEFKSLIDQFPGLHWAHLTGEGSSFFNPDFIKMVEYVKEEKKASVYMVDSFNDIKEEYMKKLIDFCVEGVYISIDAATAETYQKIRVGCNFNRVVENVRKFIHLKREHKAVVPEISFRFIIMTHNVHEVPKFLDLVHSFGTMKDFGKGSRIDFVGNLEYPEVKNFSVYELPDDIIKETLEKAKNYGFNVFLSHTEPKKNPCIEQCYAWLEPYVMMDGYVVSCCNTLMSNKRAFLKKHAFGHLKENSFTKIWNSERYRKFRETVNKKDRQVPIICTGCRAYNWTDRAKKYGIDKGL